MHQIATLLRLPDLIDHDVAYQEVAIPTAHQIVAELQRDDLRHMLVLGDRLISSSLSSQSPRQSSSVSTGNPSRSHDCKDLVDRAKLIDVSQAASPVVFQKKYTNTDGNNRNLSCHGRIFLDVRRK